MLDANAPLPCLKHNIPTHRLAYALTYFDISHLSYAELPYVTILSRLMQQLATKRRSYLYMGTYQSVLNAMLTAVTIVVVLAGSRLIVDGNMAIPDLITFLLYIANFTEPVKKLINFTEQFQNGYSGYTRFREIMDIEPDIADKEGAKTLTDVCGTVEFRDVSFRYEDAMILQSFFWF